MASCFFADIQIELKDDADNLIFENEHQLSKEPMEIDVLIIKKEKNKPVKKNIGRIFKQYNIVEYKGPGDYLSVDDFYKVYGYTCFYKADVPLVNSISISELTITFVSEKYPQKLIRHLKTVRNFMVEMTEPGIYFVKGDILPIQIIVTKMLSETENLWLKSLTNNLKESEKAKKLIEDYLVHTENNLYHSVLDTIMRANQKVFMEVNGMTDIVMEIVQEKFDRKLKEETAKAVEKHMKGVKKELEQEVREEVARKVRKEMEKEVRKEMEKEVRNEVEKEVRNEVEKEVRNEVEKEVRNKVEKEVRSEAEKKIETEKIIERISLIRKKCAKKKSLLVTAEEMELEPDEISLFYHVISENPGKTAQELYELIEAANSKESVNAINET